MLIPRSVSHHRPGVRDDQPFQYDTNDWFSIENESLLLCSLAVISLRITWALRHAHRLGILLVRPLRMQSHQATQIGPGCVVDYFHDGTSLLCKLLLPAVYRSCSFAARLRCWYTLPVTRLVTHTERSAHSSRRSNDLRGEDEKVVHRAKGHRRSIGSCHAVREMRRATVALIITCRPWRQE